MVMAGKTRIHAINPDFAFINLAHEKRVVLLPPCFMREKAFLSAMFIVTTALSAQRRQRRRVVRLIGNLANHFAVQHLVVFIEHDDGTRRNA